MRDIDTVFVHCTATKPEWMQTRSTEDKVGEIDHWHKQLGWNGFGYHWLIDRDGKIAKGRDEQTHGAHVRGHNDNSIGVVLVGGFGSEADDLFEDHYTEEQRGALIALLREISDRHDIEAICGHNEVAAKACPGFNVSEFLSENPIEGEEIAGLGGFFRLFGRIVDNLVGDR